MSGALAGKVFRISEDRVTVGRSAEATVRFHPVEDLEVSSIHAVVTRRGDAWYLRDLDSRNGTWLDGARVATEQPLSEGSRIRFGSGGPEVEVRRTHAGLPDRASVESPKTLELDPNEAPSTPSQRIAALTRRNRTLTRVLVVAFLLIGAGLTSVGYAWMQRDEA